MDARSGSVLPPISSRRRPPGGGIHPSRRGLAEPTEGELRQQFSAADSRCSTPSLRHLGGGCDVLPPPPRRGSAMSCLRHLGGGCDVPPPPPRRGLRCHEVLAARSGLSDGFGQQCSSAALARGRRLLPRPHERVIRAELHCSDVQRRSRAPAGVASCTARHRCGSHLWKTRSHPCTPWIVSTPSAASHSRIRGARAPSATSERRRQGLSPGCGQAVDATSVRRADPERLSPRDTSPELAPWSHVPRSAEPSLLRPLPKKELLRSP